MGGGGDLTVGIVVPAYDVERWIGETLRSIQDQTFGDWCCVVVDDGSHDRTAEVVRAVAADDPRIRLVRQPNGGLPAALNTGLAALPTCGYAAFIDGDDVWLPQALETLVAALDRRQDAVGAYGLAEYIDEEGEPLHPGLHPERQRWRREIRGRRLVRQPVAADATFATMAVVGPIWPPAVALHRMEAVRAVGGFDTFHRAVGDWDLYLRLSRSGPYVAVDEQVAGYRRRGANMTCHHDDIMFECDQVRRRAWESADNTADQRRDVLWAWRRLEARQVLVLGRHAVRSCSRRCWSSAAEAAVGVLICSGLCLRTSPPPAKRRRTRWTRPDDHLAVPL